MGRTEFEHRAVTDLKSAIDSLEELVACLRAGTVSLSDGKKHAVLLPASPVELSIEASCRKSRQSLSIGISWRCAPPVSKGSRRSLTISTEPPAPRAEPAQPAEGQGKAKGSARKGGSPAAAPKASPRKKVTVKK